MSDPDVSLEPATPSDLDRVERLLAANDLPTADVRANAPQFYVARADDDPVGVGGLEFHGDVGLLRSVVVPDTHRGRGYGTAICAELEAAAGQADLETLYLLTTTATGFFREHGYVVVDRAAAPERLRSSRQFADLCPDSATCMRKSL